MNKVTLINDLKRFGRTKAASKSVKGTVNERRGEGRPLTSAPFFSGTQHQLAEMG